MSEKQRLYRNVVVIFSAQLVLFLRGLLIMPVVIKMAGVAVFGAYVIVGSFVTFVFAVSALGTNYAYRRKLPSTPALSDQRALLMPQLQETVASSQNQTATANPNLPGAPATTTR